MSTALRIARRDIARHRARSLLVMLLVALPLALLSAVAVLDASGNSTEEQARSEQFGRAVAAISLPGAAPIDMAKLTLVAGQRAVPITSATVRATVGTRPVDLSVSGAAWSDPIFTGRVRGRMGDDPGVVWAGLGSQDDGVTPGGSVTVDGRQYRVEGPVQDMNMPGLLVDDDSPLAGRTVTEVLVEGPVPSQQQLDAWQEAGLSARLRTDSSGGHGTDPAATAALVLTGTLIATTVAATICAAAFSVGIARQRRDLALLQLVGAPGAVLQRTVAAQGLLLGLPAALAGAGLGAGAAALFVRSRLGDVTRSYYGVHVPWLLLVAVVLIATAGATLAAWLPARRLGRQEVRGGLRSSAPAPVRPRFSWPAGALLVLGLLVAVLGSLALRAATPAAGLTFGVPVEKFVIAGMIADALVFFALVANAGAITALAERLSGRGSLPWRLALRDITHHRGRTASALVATMAAATLFSGTMLTLDTLGTEEVAHHVNPRPGWAAVAMVDVDHRPLPAGARQAVVDAVGSTLGAPGQVVEAQAPAPGSMGATAVWPDCQLQCAQQPALLVATRQQAAQLLGAAATPAVLAALDKGSVVSTETGLTPGESTTITITRADDTVRTVRAPLVRVDGPRGFSLVSPATARALGLGRLEPQLLLQVPRTTDWEVVSRASHAVRQAGPETGLQMEVDAGDDYAPLNHYLLPIALVVLVLIGAITSALARQDSLATQRGLAGVGASTRTLRTVLAAQAGLASALGMVLGCLAGTGPMALTFLLSGGRMPLAAPVGYLALLLVGVPLLVAALAWLLARPPAPRAVRID